VGERQRVDLGAGERFVVVGDRLGGAVLALGDVAEQGMLEDDEALHADLGVHVERRRQGGTGPFDVAGDERGVADRELGGAPEEPPLLRRGDAREALGVRRGECFVAVALASHDNRAVSRMAPAVSSATASAANGRSTASARAMSPTSSWAWLRYQALISAERSSPRSM
jgi:hypothetical protein